MQIRMTDTERLAGVTPVDDSFDEGHVERYGRWVNASTDFTAAFQAVAAVARKKVGLTVRFTRGRTYCVWPSGSGPTLFDFDGALGVRVEGNGALISAGNVHTSRPVVFDLRSVASVRIHDLRYTQAYATLDSNNGGVFFLIRKGSSRIAFENCRQLNGLLGITVRGALTGDGGRSERITAINCHFENVYYPQNFQASGDQYFARGIRTIGCGRGYFPYNVRQHDVEMVSQQAGPFDDCLLKVYADPRLTYNRLENIRLKYWSDGKHPSGSSTTSGAIVTLDASQNTSTSTPAQFANIDIDIAFDAGPTAKARKVFECKKFTSAGVPDTTARGHVFTNIRIRGTVRNWQNATSDCLDFFGTADGYDWTGDAATNIKVENFSATGNPRQLAIHVNGQPFTTGSGITLENVVTNMQIRRSNWTAQKPFNAINVTAANIAG